MRKILVLAVILSLFSTIAFADIPPVGPDTPAVDFIVALLLTIIVEIAVSFVYLHYKKLPKKVLISVACVNILSVPIVWVLVRLYIFNLINPFCALPLIVIEGFVVLTEAKLLHLLNKKCLNTKDAFWLSLLNNAASFFLWLLIMFFNSLPYLMDMFQGYGRVYHQLLRG